ncbi:hypothetical protein ACFL2Q_03175, partial [Thermodesulfobacteriota bacterium]
LTYGEERSSTSWNNIQGAEESSAGFQPWDAGMATNPRFSLVAAGGTALIKAKSLIQVLTKATY